MTEKKPGARQRMLNFILENGWALDTTQKVSSMEYGKRNQRVQDPHAFTKPAAHGGSWRIKLDYINDQGFSQRSYDDRLRAMDVDYINPDGTRETGRYPSSPNVGTLRKPSSYEGLNFLWVATTSSFAQATLRQRAELIVEKPDLIVWLAKEASYKEDVRRQAEEVAREEDRIERAKPLPITVTPYEWRVIARELVDAVEAVKKADGKSDLYALMETARVAFENAQAVLKTDEWKEIPTHPDFEVHSSGVWRQKP